MKDAFGSSRSLAMRQRKLGSHTPPCHRRMLITTLPSVFLAALQRRPVLYHTRLPLGRLPIIGVEKSRPFLLAYDHHPEKGVVLCFMNKEFVLPFSEAS